MIFDRFKAAFFRMIGVVWPTIDYFAPYPSKVDSQNSDQSLDLTPDDKRIPGLQHVPLWLPFPGATVKVAAGQRVILGFLNGRPSKPFASLWDPSVAGQSGALSELDVNATAINLNNGSNGAARKGDTVNVGSWTAALNTLTFTPADGSPPQSFAFAGGGTSPIVITPTGSTGKGKIDEGSSSVKIG